MNIYICIFIGLIIVLILVNTKENFVVTPISELSKGFICDENMDKTIYGSLCKEIPNRSKIDRLSKIIINENPLNLNSLSELFFSS